MPPTSIAGSRTIHRGALIATRVGLGHPAVGHGDAFRPQQSHWASALYPPKELPDRRWQPRFDQKGPVSLERKSPSDRLGEYTDMLQEEEAENAP